MPQRANSDDRASPREVWKRDWEQAELCAQLQRIVERLVQWADDAPHWPPYQSARQLLAAFAPRLQEMQTNLGRVLVIGLVGGTGVGKSTLINALVGERVCPTGEHRPTTCQPVVVCHRDVDPSFLQLDGEQIELCQLELPLLQEMILIDCPDPDTEGADSRKNRNREILRRVLPHCDVILYVGSAQKYKTHAVQQEVLRHAGGCSVLFVQSRAGVDHDIREDWKATLEQAGFRVPPIFLLDSEAALACQRQEIDAPEEFQRLRRHLQLDIAQRARHRIKRANVLDLLGHLVSRIRTDVQQHLEGISRLQAALNQQRREIFVKIQRHAAEQLKAHRPLWQNRLAGEVINRWGVGLFTGLLRWFGSMGALLNLLLFARARTPVQLLVAGGFTAGKMVGDTLNNQQGANRWISAADLGVGDADLIQAGSIVRGFARDAAVDVAPSRRSPKAEEEQLAQELQGVAQRLYGQMEGAIDRAVEQQVARRAGRPAKFVVEGLLTALVAYVLFLLGRNFFYEVPWRGMPLLGLDFFVHALLWIVVAALVLRWGLLRRLGRGLDRQIARLVDELPTETILGPLYADIEAACCATEQHAERLQSIEAEVQQLKNRFGKIEDFEVGKIAHASVPAIPDGQ